MPANDALILRPVRMMVLTDWDAGFQLRPNLEPLPDVAPGEEYTSEISPGLPIAIREVFVRDFQLVQIATDKQIERVAPVERGSGLPRLYRLEAPITVSAGGSVIIRLRNDGIVPLKQKIAALVRENAAAARVDPAPIGRGEDAVACPACGKGPGDSCDGPASHPSRMRALHVQQARIIEEKP
jgi:hypothetical protein